MPRLLISILLLCFLAVPCQAFMDIFGNAPQPVTVQNNLITVDAAPIQKGQAQFYSYRENNAQVRFFIVRDQQGIIRVALDACDICWRDGKGYRLQDDSMLCIKCGRLFALERIGLVRGGCNPHPTPFTLDGEKVRLTPESLIEGKTLFPENL